MTIVIERRSLNARGYFSLYYLSLTSTNLKSRKSQDLRMLTDRKSKLANGQL